MHLQAHKSETVVFFCVVKHFSNLFCHECICCRSVPAITITNAKHKQMHILVRTFIGITYYRDNKGKLAFWLILALLTTYNGVFYEVALFLFK